MTKDIGQIITDIVDKEVLDKDVALFLGAGTDACSLGIAAKRLGKNVHGYTFQIDDNQTFDSKHAEEICKKMGWKWTLVKVPSANLKKDFITLAEKYHCRKKTHFECGWPFLYVYPVVEEKYIMAAHMADAHWFNHKNLRIKNICGPKSKKSDLDAQRRKYWIPLVTEGRKSLNAVYNPAGWWQHLLLCDEYEKEMCNPYEKKEVFDFYMQYDWCQIMQPYEKHQVIEAFQTEFDLIGHRRHLNLQLAGRIPDVFETVLLTDKKINFNNRKRTMDLCRDWYEKVQRRKTKLGNFVKL